MENGEDLFLTIIDALERDGVLEQIVLVGSWALPVYRAYFDDAPEIPLLRTTDIDFLVGMPPNIHVRLDVPGLLSGFGFEPVWSLQGRHCKYVHPEMEIEFLVPERGRGVDHSIKVEALNVEAQPLRFLSLAFERSMLIHYHGHDIRVPEPEAFILLKMLVIPRRKDPAKIEKDIYVTRALGEFLLDRVDRKSRLKDLFVGLPAKWQKRIRDSATIHFPVFLESIGGK